MAGEIKRGPAIVLRQYPIGESDRLLVLLTREWGKLRVLAKGMRRSRKRGLASLDLLSLADVELAGSRRSDWLRLSGGRVIEPFWPLSADPLRLCLAFCLVEEIDLLIEDDTPVPDKFELLLVTLGELAAGRGVDMLRVSELKLLALSGLLPLMERCPRCGVDPLKREGTARYSFSAQAAFCARCAGTNRTNPALSQGSLRAIRAAAMQPIESLPRMSLTDATAAELDALVPRMIEYHLGRKLRGLRVLAQLRAGREPAARDVPAPGGRSQ
ncbi:MAG: DNA repair protein RecO [Candidatus Alcyoniella australis]|nr:DNA repair protein RecO [Candidatus Alcyoniella australis]